MFDDLRKESDTSAFFQEEESEPLLDAKPKKRGSGGLGFKINDNFLGMTAFQRFVISMMLLMVVCIMGTMFLLVTGKLLLPL